mgnify:CR=1 FL=1
MKRSSSKAPLASTFERMASNEDNVTTPVIVPDNDGPAGNPPAAPSQPAEPHRPESRSTPAVRQAPKQAELGGDERKNIFFLPKGNSLFCRSYYRGVYRRRTFKKCFKIIIFWYK